MITFIDTLSATCQRMNDKKDCERLQFAIKRNIMKKKRRRYLWQEQQMYLHVLSLK